MANYNFFDEIEGFNLFGEPLFQAPFVTPLLGSYEVQKENFEKALKDYEADPSNVDNLIWLGRRAGFLGKYKNAIAVFTKGIKRYPEDPRMYRHRAHRFITLRRFRLAIDDFKKAVDLIKGKPPNRLHFNIWYHLGLSYYLENDLGNALSAYKECMKVSETDDKYVATAHWMYMTLRLLGSENEEASEVLEKISKDMDIKENMQYFQCVLMYKGENTPSKLMDEAREQGEFGLTTIGYGVANWYNYNGERDKALETLKEIHDVKGWASFGYIAAEADLKRLSQGK